MVDKEKYKGRNDYFFTEINPEEKYKEQAAAAQKDKPRPSTGPNDILKFQIIVNMNGLPEGVTQQSIAEKTKVHTVDNASHRFDRHSRIIKTGTKAAAPNKISSSSGAGGTGAPDEAMDSQAPTNAPITLEKCLINMRKKDTLENDNAYRCDKCAKYVSGTKQNVIYTVPPVLVFCLQRFKHG